MSQLCWLVPMHKAIKILTRESNHRGAPKMPWTKPVEGEAQRGSPYVKGHCQNFANTCQNDV